MEKIYVSNAMSDSSCNFDQEYASVNNDEGLMNKYNQSSQPKRKEKRLSNQLMPYKWDKKTRNDIRPYEDEYASVPQ